MRKSRFLPQQIAKILKEFDNGRSAERIYLNRENRKWLKEKGIWIVGVPMGRPPREELTAHQKRQRKKERNQRNHIEGKLGQGKNVYGLGKIQARRRDISESWIGAA